MSGKVASGLAAIVLLSGVGGAIAWVVSEDMAREQATRDRLAAVTAGAHDALAITDKYLTPEQRFQAKRAGNLAARLRDDGLFNNGVYPVSDRERLYQLTARLIAEGHCTLAEVTSSPPAPYPSTGHLPMYQAFCSSGGVLRTILLYPATDEFTVSVDAPKPQ